MNKVYLVMMDVDYEGSEVECAFSTEASANKKCEDLNNKNSDSCTGFSVIELEVQK